MEINEEYLKSSVNSMPLGKIRNNILMDKMANEWLKIGKQMKDPEPLFEGFWHQGEVGILFANTGKGKSILAVQIADAISKGESIMDLGIRSRKKIVLYFDFELSTKAFQQRYSTDNNELYNFSEQFIRVEIDRTKSLEENKISFEELIINSIKEQVAKNKSEVIIIDNITFLSASNEKSQEAMALMKLILDLSRKDNLSILLIAHTPKRDVYRPLQLEDLAGSKALSNFVDVCFCIGESVQGNDLRYIKQLKNRNYPVVYGPDNVINCRLVKNNSFLMLESIGFGSEKDHLQPDLNNQKVERYQEAKRLKATGKKNVEIAKYFEVDEKTIRRWLKK